MLKVEFSEILSKMETATSAVGATKRNKIIAVIVGVAVAIIGIILVVVQAGSATVSVEPELATIASPAKAITDTTASGGKAVQFGPPVVTTPPTESGMKGAKLYADPRYVQEGRPGEIYNQQVGRWFGNWTNNVRAETNTLVSAAAAKGELALLVAYNIPGRDCNGYSSGGAGNSGAYRSWVREFAAGVGQRKAIVVLEPDALAQLDCLNTADQNARIADIADAVSVFKSQTKAFVYIDGGNATWKSVDDMASRLTRANVANAQGFSLNVSNFITTDDSASYGEKISAKLAGKPYVIDTSRNGKGPTANQEWCNPRGRGLGKKPTTTPANGPHADAYLWIKTIGESDGDCNGDPAAGQWFPSYAQELIKNAVY